MFGFLAPPDANNFTRTVRVELAAHNMLSHNSTVLELAVDVQYPPVIEPIEWYVMVGLAAILTGIFFIILVLCKYRAKFARSKQSLINSETSPLPD